MRLCAPRRLSALVLLLILVFMAGCGSDGPEPSQDPPETVDELPELPRGWEPYVNHRAGFALGRPPGWKAKAAGSSTLLTSPDRLVAVSVSADRTNEAIDFPLDAYATGAVEALDGFEDLDAADPRPFEAHYDAVAVIASGESEDGVRQRLEFIALRRDEIATYAVLVARNIERESGFYAREAGRMVRTLRGRPIG